MDRHGFAVSSFQPQRLKGPTVNENINSIEDLKATPWWCEAAWMRRDLKLQSSQLPCFALLWEREIGSADSSRIDSEYMCRALECEPSELFTTLCALVKNGLVKPIMAGGDFLGNFAVDMDAVLARVAGHAAPADADDDE